MCHLIYDRHLRKVLIYKSYYLKVKKIKNFFAYEILREINFSHFEKVKKTGILTILGQKFSIRKTQRPQIYQNPSSHDSKSARNDFTKKYQWPRKILEFPHCVYTRVVEILKKCSDHAP